MKRSALRVLCRGMADFRTRRWSGPPGHRLHVLVPANAALRRLAAGYEPVLRAVPNLRVVPVDRLHMTVAWIASPPADDLGDCRRELVSELQRLLDRESPGGADVGLTAPQVEDYGVRLHAPEPVGKWLPWLQEQVRRLLADMHVPSVVMPAQPTTTWHVALGYAVGDLAPDLQEQLNTVPVKRHLFGDVGVLNTRNLLVVDRDTFDSPAGEARTWPLSWRRGHLLTSAWSRELLEPVTDDSQDLRPVTLTTRIWRMIIEALRLCAKETSLSATEAAWEASATADMLRASATNLNGWGRHAYQRRERARCTPRRPGRGADADRRGILRARHAPGPRYVWHAGGA